MYLTEYVTYKYLSRSLTCRIGLHLSVISLSLSPCLSVCLFLSLCPCLYVYLCVCPWPCLCPCVYDCRFVSIELKDHVIVTYPSSRFSRQTRSPTITTRGSAFGSRLSFSVLTPVNLLIPTSVIVGTPSSSSVSISLISPRSSSL